MAKQKKTKTIKIKNLVIPTEIILKITKEDIEEGTPNSGESCPIALSAASKFELVTGEIVDDKILQVDSDGIQVNLGFGLVARYGIPKKALDFIDKFDDQEDEFIYDQETGEESPNPDYVELKPFSFTAKLLEFVEA